MKGQEKLESLLEKGIITQEEFDHLQRQENKEKTSLGKSILSIIFKIFVIISLTIIAIIAIFFGVCFIIVKSL